MFQLYSTAVVLGTSVSTSKSGKDYPKVTLYSGGESFLFDCLPDVMRKVTDDGLALHNCSVTFDYKTGFWNGRPYTSLRVVDLNRQD